MELTRRKLLSGGVVAVAGGSLAACADTLPPFVINGGINPAFVDEVVSVLRSGCAVGLQFIPTATAIANVVASLFGAAAIASVQLINGAVAAVASEICAAIPPAPAAQANLRARLLRSSAALPIYVGTTPHGVVITGYRTLHHSIKHT